MSDKSYESFVKVYIRMEIFLDINRYVWFY